MPDAVCDAWVDECIKAGVKPEYYNKYKNDPYMLSLLAKGKLAGSTEKPLSPFSRWCEDKAEIEQ